MSGFKRCLSPGFCLALYLAAPRLKSRCSSSQQCPACCCCSRFGPNESPHPASVEAAAAAAAWAAEERLLCPNSSLLEAKDACRAEKQWAPWRCVALPSENIRVSAIKSSSSSGKNTSYRSHPRVFLCLCSVRVRLSPLQEKPLCARGHSALHSTQRILPSATAPRTASAKPRPPRRRRAAKQTPNTGVSHRRQGSIMSYKSYEKKQRIASTRTLEPKLTWLNALKDVFKSWLWLFLTRGLDLEYGKGEYTDSMWTLWGV